MNRTNTRANILATLESFRHLTENWDGLGARPPSGKLIDTAIQNARYLFWFHDQALTRMVAGPNGTLFFEWQLEGGVYFEVEFVDSGRIEFMLAEPSKPPLHWVLFAVEGSKAKAGKAESLLKEWGFQAAEAEE